MIADCFLMAMFVLACILWGVSNVRNGMTIDKLKSELNESRDRLTLRDQVLAAYENDVVEFNKRELDSIEALKRFNHRMADYCRDREAWNTTLLAKNAEIEGLQVQLKKAGVKPPEQQAAEHDLVGVVGCHAAGACGCNRKTMPRTRDDEPND